VTAERSPSLLGICDIVARDDQEHLRGEVIVPVQARTGPRQVQDQLFLYTPRPMRSPVPDTRGDGARAFWRNSLIVVNSAFRWSGLRPIEGTRLCGRNPWHAFLTGSRIGFCSNHCVTGIREPDMLTGMTERDWLITLEVFDAVQSSRGEPGHDDREFLEAIHYFTVHSVTWRALPTEFGNWNSVWKRFWRLSRSGVFEAFFQILAECSETAHLIQFFDSTTARAHVSAAGAKGGSRIRPSAARVAASRPKSTSRPISTAVLSTST
jgi:transposase